MATEFSKKTPEQLTKELHTRREKLASIRFTMAGGKVKNVREARIIRKEVAQILTELTSQTSA